MLIFNFLVIYIHIKVLLLAKMIYTMFHDMIHKQHNVNYIKLIYDWDNIDKYCLEIDLLRGLLSKIKTEQNLQLLQYIPVIQLTQSKLLKLTSPNKTKESIINN